MRNEDYGHVMIFTAPLTNFGLYRVLLTFLMRTPFHSKQKTWRQTEGVTSANAICLWPAERKSTSPSPHIEIFADLLMGGRLRLMGGPLRSSRYSVINSSLDLLMIYHCWCNTPKVLNQPLLFVYDYKGPVNENHGAGLPHFTVTPIFRPGFYIVVMIFIWHCRFYSWCRYKT